jgi:uncharacterized membrane-anchored protein
VIVRRFTSAVFCALLTFLGFAGAAIAQQQSDLPARFAALNWQEGPVQGDLGGMATIQIPAGYRFLGRGDAGKFMELNQNPSDGSELGLLLSDDPSFFVVFEFSGNGYVKDDDRDLDADAILAGIREGTEQGNKIRRERGWPTMEVVGWQQRPFYDAETNNLTWSIRGSSEGSTSINHSTRLLGRRGVMNVNLVLSPEDVGNAVPAFNALLRDFSFNPGQRYAEFTRGDKVAEYGLTGLIVGGAGVALVKTGLLQKFWKLIVIGFIALAGAIKRFVSSLGRGREAADQRSHV